jgi:hypothetical protein
MGKAAIQSNNDHIDRHCFQAKENIKSQPLVKSEKVVFLPLHVQFCLTENVKAMDQCDSRFLS